MLVEYGLHTLSRVFHATYPIAAKAVVAQSLIIAGVPWVTTARIRTTEILPTPIRTRRRKRRSTSRVLRTWRILLRSRTRKGRTSSTRADHGSKNGGGAVTNERKERRGFASMSPEKQREIASKGGRAAHEKGTAHEWTADEARSAGRKGGQVSRGGRGRLIVPSEPVPAGAADQSMSSDHPGAPRAE